jgi:ribosome-associated protein
MADVLPVGGSVSIPEAELRWRFSRSGGPGGQGVNTTDSRVELVFDVTASTAFTEQQRERVLERLSRRLVAGVVTVVASEYRSQLRNREAARSRLAAMLRDALAPDPPTRRPTRPSRAARERRLADKRRRMLIKRLRRSIDD